MPRIKHIALTTKDPGKTAAFYKEAFGMQEIRRAPNGAVFLTDGYINLAVLNWKTENNRKRRTEDEERRGGQGGKGGEKSRCTLKR